MTTEESPDLISGRNFLRTVVGFLLLIQLFLFFILFKLNTNIYALGLGWCLLIPGFTLIILSEKHYQKSTDDSKSSGIYQYVQYPMHIGWMVSTIGMLLISLQWFTIFYAIIIPIIFLSEIKREE